MGSVTQKLKTAWYTFLGYLIVGSAIALLIGLFVFLWWLDHVRFTF